MLKKASDIGKMLGISTWQVYDLTAKGKVPGVVRFGPRTIRYNREVIQQWIANGCPDVNGNHDAHLLNPQAVP